MRSRENAWGRQRRWEAPAALAAGLLLRALFVWKHPRFVGDTLIYGDLAHNLLAHGKYALTEGDRIRSTLIRLPGYPLFLTVCFALFGTGNYLAVIWVQVGVDLLGCWLLSRLAARMFGERVGLLCLWLAALCPFTANYAAAALTETLSIFCVTTALFALGAWIGGQRAMRWPVMVGVALSGAVLLRPDGILLSGAVLPVMAWAAWRERPGGLTWKRRAVESLPLGARANRKAWAGFCVAAGLVVLCLGLWTMRNWEVYRVLQPLAPKYANDPGEGTPWGFARWYRTWGAGLEDTARVYWEYDGDPLQMSDLPTWALDSPAERRETEQAYRHYNDDTSSTPRSETEFNQLATERIRRHPVRSLVGMPLVRLGDMWLRPRTELMQRMPLEWWDVRGRPWASLFSYVYGLLNVLLLLLAGVGLWRWRRTGWRGWAPIAAAMVGYVALRSALLCTIDNSEPRYVLEAYPVVVLLAAVAVGGGGGKVSSKF